MKGILAALALGLTLGVPADARPILSNGTSLNGVWQNGVFQNGVFQNGVFQNGIWQNGIWQNGIWENGIRANYLATNGINPNRSKLEGSHMHEVAGENTIGSATLIGVELPR